MTDSQNPNPLSEDEARQLAEHLSFVTQAGLPMAPALRAAAAELPNRRLAGASKCSLTIWTPARPWTTFSNPTRALLPQYMRRLIETGCRTGNLPEVLVEIVEIDRRSAELKRSMRLALAYPLLLIILWVGVVVFLITNVVPALGKLFDDFKTSLPWSTHLLVQISGPHFFTVIAFLLAAVPMIIIALKISLRPLGWHRLLIELPLYGPTLLWRGVANWSRLLALLVKQDVPLPDATRFAAEGIYSPVVSVDGLRISKMVAGGRKLTDAISTVRDLPASLLPIVRWGEDHNALPDALDSAADMFENRVNMRAVLLQSILPSLIFILAAAGALWIVNAMIAPLTKLITDLSGVYYRNGTNQSGLLWLNGSAQHASQIVLAMSVVWLVLILLVGFNRSPLSVFLSRLFGGSGNPARSGLRAQLRTLFRSLLWILTFVLLLVFMVGTSGPWGFLLWLATIVIAVSLRARYGQMERRALLWLLAVAVEKGFPLPEAAQAFADERYDRLGVQAHRLAIAISQGLPLDRALAVTNIRLPNDALVAVRTGSVAGGLAPLLKNAARHAAAIDAAVQSAIGRIIYLMLFILFTSFVITFIQLKIIPAFQKIFADFHQRLPPVSLAMLRVFYVPLHFPVFMAFLASLFTAIILCFLYTLARYMGLLRWDPPVVRQLSLPLDQSLILRSLAESVDSSRTLDTALWTLAKSYPKGYIRRRLRDAAQRTDSGSSWVDSLQSNNLLTTADAGVLHAAERVGNLSWAMNNTADRLVRRFTTRLLGLMSITFPVILIAFGAVVFLIAVGIIYPLAQLILHLA